MTRQTIVTAALAITSGLAGLGVGLTVQQPGPAPTPVPFPCVEDELYAPHAAYPDEPAVCIHHERYAADLAGLPYGPGPQGQTGVRVP